MTVVVAAEANTQLVAVAHKLGMWNGSAAGAVVVSTRGPTDVALVVGGQLSLLLVAVTLDIDYTPEIRQNAVERVGIVIVSRVLLMVEHYGDRLGC